MSTIEHPQSKSTPRVTRLGIALVAATAGLAAPRAAAASRLVVALEEVVDGEKAASSEAEVALMEVLRADDRWVFVDAEQSRKVLAASGTKSLLDANVKDLVTSLTADVLVVGRVELSAQDPGPFKSVAIYEASAQVKMIAVDSAEVVNAFRVSIVERHFRPRAARSQAAGALAKAIAAKLAPPGTPRIQLEVALEPGLGARDADRIAGCIGHTPGVEKVEIRHFDSRVLRMEMRSKDPAPKLARAITKVADSRGCGLGVVAYSARQVRLHHSPSLALELSPTKLVSKGRVAAKDRWIGAELSRSLATEIGQVSYVRLAEAGALADPRGARAKKPGRLVLEGSYRVRGATANVSAELFAAYRRRLLIAEKASCPVDDLDACVRTISERLRAGLLPALQANKNAVPLRTALPKPAPAPLRVVKVELDGIYPSRLGHYHAVSDAAGAPVNPVGYVVVENQTDARIEGLTVAARIEGLSDKGLTVEPVALDPRSTATLPIYLRFDPARLAAHDDNRSEVLQLALSFEQDDLTYPLDHDVGVMVYERNAVNWAKEKDSVAAFVSPRAPSVVSLVDAVQSALPSSEEHRLGLPIALFESLKGLEYRKDPDNPYRPDELDSVLYPGETLARGGGDCDDLAVTYASMLQAAGWATMLVQTPGHVFVALGTEVPPSNAVELSVDPDAVIVSDETLWVPVETTQVGKSFVDAWHTAARELREARRAKKAPTLIRVRDAWKRFPPVDLGAPTTAKAAAVPKSLASAVRENLEVLRTERAKTVARLEKSSDPADINRYGVLLAQSGDRAAAAKAFAKSRDLAETGPVLNNLGNLELIEQRPKDAYALYERAIGLDGDNLSVRVNAILALHSLARSDGESVAYEKAFVRNVLELHARAPQVVAGLQARLPQIGKTGSAGGATSVDGLVDRIDSVLEEAGRATRPAPIVTRSRPGDSGLARHVNWLY